MFIRGDSDAANPLILRYSAGDQQCRDAGFLSSATLFRPGFLKQITFTARNIYRLALPLFVGIFDGVASSLFIKDLPLTIRPLLSNGLLVGILLAVLMENLIPWGTH